MLPKSPTMWLSTKRFGTTTKKVRARSLVNQVYKPQHKPIPILNPVANETCPTSYSAHHKAEYWSDDQVIDSLQKNCLMAWGATDPMMAGTTKVIRSSDGPYLYDTSGKKYIDFSSQAVCNNFGHSMPQSIRDAIDNQIDEVCFLYGGLAVSEIRARLSSLLAEIFPADIDAFLYPSSGSEANEAAIRMARKYTGRKKILSRYRSYHGGTLGSLAMTGDARRFDVDKDVPGFIKIFDPYPMFFEWQNDCQDEAVIAQKALESLHEQIILENPKDIAAICVEGITGANGWLKPPVQYMQGLRALCDTYGIQLICDEVMAGFGRTGKMLSFQHFEGVVPDIVTFAKGLTGAFMPLSGVGVRSHLMEFFRTTPMGYGSTYQGHPLSMACAYGTVKYLMDNNLVEHAQNMEQVMRQEMQSLLDEMPEAVYQARVHGMGGCIDLGDPDTMDILCSTNEAHPKAAKLRKTLNQNGLITLIRGPVLHITPPLISTQEDIEYGFQILRKSLKESFYN